MDNFNNNLLLDESSLAVVPVVRHRTLFELAIDKINEKKFQQLLDKEFIRHLVNRQDLKIAVRTETVDQKTKKIIVYSTGEQVHVVIKRCMDGTTEEDRRFRTTLNFFFALVYNVSPHIRNHPRANKYIRRFLLDTYFEIKQNQIWKPFIDNIKNSLYVAIEPSEIISVSFFLDETQTYWQALNHCFHEDIFFHHLYLEFVGLSKGLLSRYLEFVYGTPQRLLGSNEEVYDDTLMDLLLDLSALRNFLGRDIIDDINNSIFKIVKSEGHFFLVDEIVNYDDQFLFAYRHIEIQYLYRTVSKIERLFLTLGLYKDIYGNPQNPDPTEPNLYIMTIAEKIDDVYELFHYRNITDVLHTTDSLVHMLGIRFLDAIDNLYYEIENSPDYNAEKLCAQLNLDVRYFIDSTSYYIYEPYHNGTFTNLLNSVERFTMF